MRRSGRLRPTGSLKRTGLRRTAPLGRRAVLQRGSVSPASEQQQAKVSDECCIVCRCRPVDPAHLVSRALGGCDEPECVVALCRPDHRAFDRGTLDLLPHLEPGCRRELAHAVEHLGLIGALRRVTGRRWGADEPSIARSRGCWRSVSAECRDGPSRPVAGPGSCSM